MLPIAKMSIHSATNGNTFMYEPFSANLPFYLLYFEICLSI